MAPIWDAPLTAATAAEIQDRLSGGRVRAVLLDREPRNLVLFFREATLVFRLHPLHGDVSVLDAREPPDGARTLRARLRDVHAPPDERLLMFQLQPPGGGARPDGVAVELMTNQWNAVWLDVGSGRIREVLWTRELSDRTLASGHIYRRPAPSERRGIDEALSPDEWRDLLGRVPTGDRRGTLLRTVAFTSSLNADALLPSPGPGSGGDGDEELTDGHALWMRLRAVALGEEEARPRLLRTPKRLQPYPLSLPGVGSDPTSSLLDAFREAADREDETDSPRGALVPSDLLSRLEQTVKGAHRKVDRLRAELEELDDPDRIRATADLILARLGELERGAEEVVLEDFGGEPVTVTLDPALSPQSNAERLYDDAARMERARRRIPTLIEDAEERARRLTALLERVRSGEASLDEVRDSIPDEPKRRNGKRDESKGLPYRRYRSSGDLEIRVGRGAAANDDLTFHHSSPDDVWMHARQVPGAHVILRWDGDGNPPGRDLAEAATLAALHSDARHSGSVPVDWTRRKYVRKPRKAPPGAVVPTRNQTIFVEPDPKLEQRLRDPRGR